MLERKSFCKVVLALRRGMAVFSSEFMMRNFGQVDWYQNPRDSATGLIRARRPRIETELLHWEPLSATMSGPSPFVSPGQRVSL